MTPLTVRDEPFDRVCTEWQGLVDQAHMPVPFVTPAWQRVWLSHFQDGRRLQIKIPAGVRDGARIKLRGAGLKEGAGALSGDLYVTVHVRPDSRFERDGANLRTEVAVTLLEAMGGAEVPIQTPTGTLKLRIRANTQNGQEIHVAGKGLPKPGRDGGRGDLIVRVRVELPHLDDETRGEMAELLAKHPQPDPRVKRTSH